MRQASIGLRLLSLVLPLYLVVWTPYSIITILQHGEIKYTPPLIGILGFVGLIHIGLMAWCIRDVLTSPQTRSLPTWLWTVLLMFWGPITIPIYCWTHTKHNA